MPSETPLDMSGIRAILAAGCQDPHCQINHPKEGLVLSPSCHMGAPVYAFARPNGTMTLVCAVCDSPVVNIQVAEAPPQGDA